MIKQMIGWLAVILSVFSLAPSYVPGAISLLGLLVSLLALVLSLASITANQRLYFTVVLVIVLVGLFLVNDTLRLYGGIPRVPLHFKIVIYAAAVFLIIICAGVSRRLPLSQRDEK